MNARTNSVVEYIVEAWLMIIDATIMPRANRNTPPMRRPKSSYVWLVSSSFIVSCGANIRRRPLAAHVRSTLPDSSRCAVLLKQAYDLFLLRFRLSRAGATAAGVLGRELHWRRAALVLASRIGAPFEKCAHGSGATSAHRAV